MYLSCRKSNTASCPANEIVLVASRKKSTYIQSMSLTTPIPSPRKNSNPRRRISQQIKMTSRQPPTRTSRHAASVNTSSLPNYWYMHRDWIYCSRLANDPNPTLYFVVDSVHLLCPTNKKEATLGHEHALYLKIYKNKKFMVDFYWHDHHRGADDHTRRIKCFSWKKADPVEL